MSQLKPEVKSLVLAQVKERLAAGTENLEWRSFLDALAAVFKDGKLTQSDYEPMVKLAEEIFDEYVVGFDIPGIPNLVEPFIENIMREGIRPVVKALFDRFVSAS